MMHVNKPARVMLRFGAALAKLASFSLVLAALGGCSATPTVQAWEKGNLARPEMGFERDALDAKFTDHIYFSKEAASGGTGVGGGGCGCN
ncbi:MAG: DUF4266 domain-containing protein [Candidatus Saccharibacteria bacterium]|nr:DUF4266 domain-containing protein [Rhodoferax sp.]